MILPTQIGHKIPLILIIIHTYLLCGVFLPLALLTPSRPRQLEDVFEEGVDATVLAATYPTHPGLQGALARGHLALCRRRYGYLRQSITNSGNFINKLYINNKLVYS